MLCTVHHLWPSGACFALNCHRDHSSIILINRDGKSNILRSTEGMTQGDLLAMVAYGIVIFDLIEPLELMYPDVAQPWYADNAGALRKFDNLEQYFN